MAARTQSDSSLLAIRSEQGVYIRMSQVLCFMGMFAIGGGIVCKYWNVVAIRSDFPDSLCPVDFQHKDLKTGKWNRIVGNVLVVIGIFFFAFVAIGKKGMEFLTYQLSIEKYIRTSLSDTLSSIFISILASYLFWTLTFKISFTKVIFAKYLVRSDASTYEKTYAYRMTFANIGYRDLIELKVIAKLVIKDNNTTHSSFLNISGNKRRLLLPFYQV